MSEAISRLEHNFCCWEETFPEGTMLTGMGIMSPQGAQKILDLSNRRDISAVAEVLSPGIFQISEYPSQRGATYEKHFPDMSKPCRNISYYELDAKRQIFTKFAETHFEPNVPPTHIWHSEVGEGVEPQSVRMRDELFRARMDLRITAAEKRHQPQLPTPAPARSAASR